MRAYGCGWMGTLVLCGLCAAQAPPATQPRPGTGQVPERALAQPGIAGQQPGAAGQPGGGASSTSDKQIAACLFLDAHKEIELARFAQSKLQTEPAKQFAEKMIREHATGHDTMKRLAGDLVASLGLDHGAHAAGAREGEPTAAPATRKTAPAGTATTQPPREPATAPRRDDNAPRRDDAASGGQGVGGRTAANPGAGGTIDWIRVHKEIGDRCLASTQKALSEHQGAEFDKAYMTQQTMAHMEMVDKLTVLRNHASGELRQHIDQELQMATGHLQQAKQIKEQMKDAPSERTTRRPQ